MSTPCRSGERVTETIARAQVSSLSESTMQELRSALVEQLRHPDAPTPEVTDGLRRLAREAQANGVTPEELLVTFKQMWNSLAESMRAPSPDQSERIRQTLVTLCIKAY